MEKPNQTDVRMLTTFAAKRGQVRRLAIATAIASFAGLAPTVAFATPSDTTSSSAAPNNASFDQKHSGWNALLRHYVHSGFVDYAALKGPGRTELDRYLASLESVTSAQYGTWSQSSKLAFWINGYNAYTVKLILEHYPLKSIRSIGLLSGAAFRENFIPLKGLRGKTLSLNHIEHDILRKEFREPRIHFAIVCASKSCPELRSAAYQGSSLDAQLNDAARRFVADRSKNRFDAASRTLYLSSIFDWFSDDFERASKTVPAFVARFSEPAVAASIAASSVQVKFLEYDWSLNGK